MKTHLSQQDKEKQTLDCRNLIQNQQTLLLSTVSIQGEPESSYAPYVRDTQGVFYIYVSDLASHTKNMMQKQSASILFIQSEQETQNLFARKRVVFNCKISEIEKGTDCYDLQLKKMQEKFGETVELLRSLSDFHLLALTPVKGRYIAGFGQAFSLNSEGEIVF